jgi:TRAP-type C4-dicarboxylate transport system permease small subunit
MTTTLHQPRSAWRRFTAGYSALLSWLLVATIAILVVPVTLQIFARFTTLIPTFIWTEEMARLMFVWSIMLGAMLGIREGTHFDVDLWPRLGPRRQAALRLCAGVAVLVMAVVFLWFGWEFTDAARNRISELAELPLWMIHIAWPLAGLTWIVFAGERFYDDLRIATGRHPVASVEVRP